MPHRDQQLEHHIGTESRRSTEVPYAAPCFTSPAFEADRDTARAPLFLPAHQTWLGALLNAMGSPVHDGPHKTAIWEVECGRDNKEATRAYMEYAKAFTSQRMPWLPHLFNLAQATVTVKPGCYAFDLDKYPGYTFPIPELEPYTHMLPWATEEERKRAN